MEFPFDCGKVLNAAEDGYSMIDAKAMKMLIVNKQATAIIDTMGERSAKVIVLEF